MTRSSNGNPHNTIVLCTYLSSPFYQNLRTEAQDNHLNLLSYNQAHGHVTAVDAVKTKKQNKNKQCCKEYSLRRISRRNPNLSKASYAGTARCDSFQPAGNRDNKDEFY